MVQVKMPHKIRLKHIIATPHLCLHLESRKYDAGECEPRRNYPLIHKQGRVSTTAERDGEGGRHKDGCQSDV